MSGPFKMKGSPMARNFGIGSPLHDEEKVVKGRTKKTVEVKGEKPERHADKWKRVKGMEGDPTKNMASEYGGTWTREDRSKKGGSKGTLVNEKGQTAKEVTLQQGRDAAAKKAEYKKENKTS